MALNTLTASCVTIVSAFQYGGQSNKKRRRLVVTINDPAATSGGIVVGANAGDLPASVFGFTKIEECSNLAIFTTSSGVVVRVYSAVPSPDGASLLLSDSGQTAGAVSDVTIATTESAQITLVGY